jgi:hypothetical protein
VSEIKLPKNSHFRLGSLHYQLVMLFFNIVPLISESTGIAGEVGWKEGVVGSGTPGGKGLERQGWIP